MATTRSSGWACSRGATVPSSRTVLHAPAPAMRARWLTRRRAPQGPRTCATSRWARAQSGAAGGAMARGDRAAQTSMAVLRPPHLKAMFCNKGGFWNAYTSGEQTALLPVPPPARCC
jgi:hypothetical protein